MSVDSYIQAAAARRTSSNIRDTSGKMQKVRFERTPGKSPIYKLSAGGYSKRFDPRVEQLPHRGRTSNDNLQIGLNG